MEKLKLSDQLTDCEDEEELAKLLTRMLCLDRVWGTPSLLSN